MINYWNDGTSLYHYGISGQKWGVRRYQNPDGTLTEEGKLRYRRMSPEKLAKSLSKVIKNGARTGTRAIGKESYRVWSEINKKAKEFEDSSTYKDLEKKIISASYEYKDSDYKSIDRYNELVDKLDHLIARNSTHSYYGGRNYSEPFIKANGDKLTVAYLRDLGFSVKESKELTEKIKQSSQYTLAYSTFSQLDKPSEAEINHIKLK